MLLSVVQTMLVLPAETFAVSAFTGVNTGYLGYQVNEAWSAWRTSNRT